MAGNLEIQGKSFSISVGAANQTVPVNLADLGLTQIPSLIQFVNNGANDVWVVLSGSSGVTAVVPTAGTTTVGTPQPGVRLKAAGAGVGPYLVRLNAIPATNVLNAAGTATGPGFYLAFIGLAAGPAVVDVSLGEGQ
jgi:hypothetical protein